MGLLLLFWPFAEIYLFVQSGETWGWVNTLFYSVMSFLFGIQMIKWGMYRVTKKPGLKAMGGMVWVMAGLLFVIPGVITDFLAILILFPPTRYLILRNQAERAAHWAQGKVNVFFSGASWPQQNEQPQERDAKVIDIIPIESSKDNKVN